MSPVQPEDPEPTPDSTGRDAAPAPADHAQPSQAREELAAPRHGVRRRDLLFAGGGLALGVAGTFGGVGAARAATRSARPTPTPTSTSTSGSTPTYTLQRFSSTMVTAPKP